MAIEEQGQHGKVKVHQGKVHDDYVGMKLDYSEKRELKIDVKHYVKWMFDSFPVKFKEGETATTPVGEDLFVQKSSNDKMLQKDKAEPFHTTVAQHQGNAYQSTSSCLQYQGTLHT